jgi:hypothetical protein
MRRYSVEQTAQPSNLNTFGSKANVLRELATNEPGLKNSSLTPCFLLASARSRLVLTGVSNTRNASSTCCVFGAMDWSDNSPL